MPTKKEWGNACWFLFHVIAAKLNENRTDLIRPIIESIKHICRNLPCPICTSHAVSSFKLLHIEKIKSKDDLINCLLQFHNFVNARTGTQQFTRENCDKKYHGLKLDKTFYTWVNIMARNTPGRNMMFTMSRNKMIVDIKKFLIENQTAFY